MKNEFIEILEKFGVLVSAMVITTVMFAGMVEVYRENGWIITIAVAGICLFPVYLIGAQKNYGNKI